MQKVIEVRAIDPAVLEVTFADGELRRVNVEPLLFGEMFEPLRDPALFRAVTVPGIPVCRGNCSGQQAWTQVI